MVSQLLSRIVILAGGMLYPAYRSYKAVRTKDVREYVKWMMYWIVFAIYCCMETFLDVFVAFWCPFYYELKILFVFYLLSPYTKGATVIYRKFIHPTLVKHESDIDILLDQAKSETYSTVRRIGSQTVYQARDLIATAAVRGQAQLLQQLSRSHSLGDVNDEEGFERDRMLKSAAAYKRRGVTVQEIREEEDVAFIDEDVVDVAPPPIAAATTTRRVYTGYKTAAKKSEDDFIDELMDDVEPRGRPPAFVPPSTGTGSKAKAATLHGDGHQVYDGFATVSPRTRTTGKRASTAGQRVTRATARAKVSSETFKAPGGRGDL